jgi:hypothetical protein
VRPERETPADLDGARSAVLRVCRHHGSATFRDRWRPPVKPCGKFVPIGQARGGICGDSAEGLSGRLPGREAERLGMGPAVVLGQDLAEVPGPVGDGAVADLAARDRKMGNGHREAAGT